MNEFESRYRREYGVFYEFLSSFYEMHQSETSYFWQAKKVIRSDHSDLESFVSLVGGVSSAEAALMDAETVAKRFQERSAEFASAVGTLTGDENDSMVPLFKSAVVRQVMQEGSQVQMSVLLGEEGEAEDPLFPDGLVSSPDGMLWLSPART